MTFHETANPTFRRPARDGRSIRPRHAAPARQPRHACRPVGVACLIAAVCLLVSTTGPAQADPGNSPGPGGATGEATQWPSRLDRNMVIDAENLPGSLSESNLLWKAELRAKWTFAQPVIAGDRILLGTTADTIEDEALADAIGRKGAALLCIDRRTGKRIWELALTNAMGMGYGVSGAPLVDGDRAYFMAGTFLVCVDLAGQANGNDGPFTDEIDLLVDRHWRGHVTGTLLQQLKPSYGDVLWYTNLKDRGVQPHDSASATPLLAGGMLWVATSHARGLKPGPAWTEPEDDEKYRGSGNPNMMVFDPQDGRLIASDTLEVERVYHGQWASPSFAMVDGEGLVFWGDGFGHLHAFEIPVREEGKVVEIPVAWSLDCVPRHHRYDADGVELPFPRHSTKKREGVPGVVVGPSHIIATPVYHEGLLYVALGRDRAYTLGDRSRRVGPGALMCIRPGRDVPAEDRIVWRTEEIGRTQSTPSIADGLLYIADMFGHLMCFDIADGRKLWTIDLECRVETRSQLLADGKIYVGTDDERFFIARAGRKGELLFSTELEDPATTVGADDGLLLIATRRGLWAYGPDKPE